MSTRRELLARLHFRQPDGADFRLGEDGGRNVAVIDLDVLSAEHGVGEGMPFADRRPA